MEALKELKRFQTDRGLHRKQMLPSDLFRNIGEEIGEFTEAYEYWNEEGMVDALADICVFAMGDIMKLGYDPEKVFEEVGKEINSREGEFINGKFTKFKTPEAVAKWYKADFTGCRL